MQVRLQSARLEGDIDIIMSKSYAHRLLILSALSDKPTTIIGRSAAQDIMATISCLQSLGAEITDTKDGYIVQPIKKVTGSVCNAGESGSTLRFLLPVAAALGTNSTFEVTGRLGQRPIKDLTFALKERGVTVTDYAPYTLHGSLQSGDFHIRGDISSQYISGLLFALPLLSGDSNIIITHTAASQSYIDITLDTIEKFGVDITKTPYGYKIKGGQRYKSPENVLVEGDWSNGAFFLAAGAISGDVNVKNLALNSTQGDKAILNVLCDMGAFVSVTENGIRVQQSSLKAVEIDADNIPDLVPIICVLAAYAKGKTVIKNVERLRYKESDRIQSTMQMLQTLGIQIGYNGSLNITGGTILGGTVNGHNDHRIVMSSSIAALGSLAFVDITTSSAVDKSYPNFFAEYKRLGGRVNVTQQ